MSNTTLATSPLEYLAAAERELAADNPLEGSRLLWKAAEATFVRLARKHRMDGSDIIDLAHALDRKERRNRYYIGAYSVANSLKHHAELEILEEYEFDSACGIIQDFVKKLV